MMPNRKYYFKSNMNYTIFVKKMRGQYLQTEKNKKQEKTSLKKLSSKKTS